MHDHYVLKNDNLNCVGVRWKLISVVDGSLKWIMIDENVFC